MDNYKKYNCTSKTNKGYDKYKCTMDKKVDPQYICDYYDIKNQFRITGHDYNSLDACLYMAIFTYPSKFFFKNLIQYKIKVNDIDKKNMHNEIKKIYYLIRNGSVSDKYTTEIIRQYIHKANTIAPIFKIIQIFDIPLIIKTNIKNYIEKKNMIIDAHPHDMVQNIDTDFIHSDVDLVPIINITIMAQKIELNILNINFNTKNRKFNKFHDLSKTIKEINELKINEIILKLKSFEDFIIIDNITNKSDIISKINNKNILLIDENITKSELINKLYGINEIVVVQDISVPLNIITQLKSQQYLYPYPIDKNLDLKELSIIFSNMEDKNASDYNKSQIIDILNKNKDIFMYDNTTTIGDIINVYNNNPSVILIKGIDSIDSIIKKMEEKYSTVLRINKNASKEELINKIINLKIFNVIRYNSESDITMDGNPIKKKDLVDKLVHNISIQQIEREKQNIIYHISNKDNSTKYNFRLVSLVSYLGVGGGPQPFFTYLLINGKWCKYYPEHNANMEIIGDGSFDNMKADAKNYKIIISFYAKGEKVN